MSYDDIINIKEYRSAESLKSFPRMNREERSKINEVLPKLVKHDIVKSTYFAEEDNGIGEERTIEAEFLSISEDRSSIILISSTEKITIRIKDLLALEAL